MRAAAGRGCEDAEAVTWQEDELKAADPAPKDGFLRSPDR